MRTSALEGSDFLCKTPVMMSKRRALLLLLALWLPLQGLAGTLLHCDTMRTAPSQHQTPHSQAAAEAHEPTEHGDCDTVSDSNSDSNSAEHCDHCQPCCQMSSTLLLSANPAELSPPAAQICQPIASADSVIFDPLLHPPKHLS